MTSGNIEKNLILKNFDDRISSFCRIWFAVNVHDVKDKNQSENIVTCRSNGTHASLLEHLST